MTGPSARSHRAPGGFGPPVVDPHRSSADGERAERAELTTELGKRRAGAEPDIWCPEHLPERHEVQDCHCWYDGIAACRAFNAPF